MHVMCQIALCCVTSVTILGVLACPERVLRIRTTADWTNYDGNINTALVLLLSKLLGNNFSPFCKIILTELDTSHM